MQVWCDWQVTLCDPHLSALEVRFSRRCAIQIDVYLTLPCLSNFTKIFEKSCAFLVYYLVQQDAKIKGTNIMLGLIDQN